MRRDQPSYLELRCLQNLLLALVAVKEFKLQRYCIEITDKMKIKERQTANANARSHTCAVETYIIYITLGTETGQVVTLGPVGVGGMRGVRR